MGPLSEGIHTFASSNSIKYLLFSLSLRFVSNIMSTVVVSPLPNTHDRTEAIDQEYFTFPVIVSLSLISLQFDLTNVKRNDFIYA